MRLEINPSPSEPPFLVLRFNAISLLHKRELAFSWPLAELIILQSQVEQYASTKSMVYEARQRFGRQDSAARHTTAEDPFEDAQERERGVEGLIDEGRQRDEGATHEGGGKQH